MRNLLILLSVLTFSCKEECEDQQKVDKINVEYRQKCFEIDSIVKSLSEMDINDPIQFTEYQRQNELILWLTVDKLLLESEMMEIIRHSDCMMK